MTNRSSGPEKVGGLVLDNDILKAAASLRPTEPGTAELCGAIVVGSSHRLFPAIGK